MWNSFVEGYAANGLERLPESFLMHPKPFGSFLYFLRFRGLRFFDTGLYGSARLETSSEKLTGHPQFGQADALSDTMCLHSIQFNNAIKYHPF